MQEIHQTVTGYWLITQGSNLCLKEQQLPFGTAHQLGLVKRKAMLLGEWKNTPLWLVEEIPNEDREFFSLQTLLALPQEQFYLLSRGIEINHFFKTHQFCGRCGYPTQQTYDELAVECINTICKYRAYPVICPSIIVAVRRGTDILLANHKRHYKPNGGIYTVLAGFVEAGETFEQAVRREVMEETGIKIKNIRYFGSQPWAFPNSQMVGFLADYESGEIFLQKTEIQDAQWFHYDASLPELPVTGTIAHKLIMATLMLCQTENMKGKINV